MNGRVAVVTGGTRGIGRAIAERYAAAGAHVVVSARTAVEVPAGIEVVEADATHPDQARLPVRHALERFGVVDVLVNNAGGARPTFEETLVLNLTTAWWTIEEALPGMKAAGWGRIINIGSGASTRAAASPGYTAAKHGLVGLTRQLAQDLGKSGITVNCLCPGWTNTSLLPDLDLARRRAGTESALGRLIEPEELTGMALLLASEDAGAVTGQVIGVDGGYRL